MDFCSYQCCIPNTNFPSTTSVLLPRTPPPEIQFLSLQFVHVCEEETGKAAAEVSFAVLLLILREVLLGRCEGS